MTASYGLALGGAFSRGVPDARDLIEQARYAVRSFVDAGADLVVIKLTCAPAEQRDQQAAFAEAVIPLVGDSGRAGSPPQPTSFTGDRRAG